MKKNWTYTTIGESCNIKYGTRIVSSKTTGSKYPVYGGGGETFRTDDYNREDCLVIARFAMSQKCTRFVKGKFFLNDSGLTVEPKKDSSLSKEFLNLILVAQNDLIYSFGRGSAQRNLRISDFKAMKIAFPNDKDEQNRLAKELKLTFSKIGCIKQNALTSLNEAISLYKSTLATEMDHKEWCSVTLKRACSKIGSGATPKGGHKVYTKEGCCLIRSLNVHHNFFKQDDLAHITDTAAEALKGVTIKENDVLFNITGASIGRCCVVPLNVIPARVNQHVCILRADNFVTPEFLCYQLNSRQHQKELLAIGEAGSTRQALTKKDLEKHTIYYPSPEEQQRIVIKLDAIINKIAEMQDNLEKIYAECEYLKDSILKQIFN